MATHIMTNHNSTFSVHLQATAADKAEASAAAAAGKNKGSGPINGTSAAEKRKQAAAAESSKQAAASGEHYVFVLSLSAVHNFTLY